MLLRTYLETERSEVPVNASARRKYKMLHAANSAAVIDFRRNAMVLILYEWLNVILAVLSACRFWLDRLLKAEFAEANLVLPLSRNVCRFRDENFFCVGDSAVLAQKYEYRFVV